MISFRVGAASRRIEGHPDRTRPLWSQLLHRQRWQRHGCTRDAEVAMAKGVDDGGKASRRERSDSRQTRLDRLEAVQPFALPGLTWLPAHTVGKRLHRLCSNSSVDHAQERGGARGTHRARAPSRTRQSSGCGPSQGSRCGDDVSDAQRSAQAMGLASPPASGHIVCHNFRNRRPSTKTAIATSHGAAPRPGSNATRPGKRQPRTPRGEDDG
jgi:hypothetical protein